MGAKLELIETNLSGNSLKEGGEKGKKGEKEGLEDLIKVMGDGDVIIVILMLLLLLCYCYYYVIVKLTSFFFLQGADQNRRLCMCEVRF